MKLRSSTLATTAAALLVFATPAAVATPASADQRLADNLVVARGDFSDSPTASWWFRSGTAPSCLWRAGFKPTARAESNFAGTPVSTVASIATVLKTTSEATRYYHALVTTMSSCLRRTWRRMSKPPWVGPARALAFPRYGDQSAAAQLPLKHPFPYNPDWHRFTDDWIVVRKGRAVVVDDFLLPLGGPSASKGNQQAEQAVLTRQLARA